MTKKKNDTSEPILVLIRRGRKGRGFTVAPVEDFSNPAMCQTSAELGEVIEEMLDDEDQPRVDMDQLLASASGAGDRAAAGDDGSEEEDVDDEDYDDEDYDDEDEDEEEGDGGQGGIFDGVAGAPDPADRLIFNLFSAAVSKGRSMSSKPKKGKSSKASRRARRHAHRQKQKTK